MSPTQIIPRYKLVLTYDIRPDMHELYYQYVTQEFVPGMQEMDLYMLTVWHTAFGDRPLRQVEFVSESLETLQDAFDSERFQALEKRLQTYIFHYSRKVVHFRDGFQF
ncbi:MAG: hypothetical protein H7175_27135 [Burkholderiales bacterium]|nr:hypothetical protein [Anaerolineae bacterium]